MNPNQIIETVSAITGISETDIRGHTRTEPVVFARWATWAIMRERGATDLAIASEFKAHSSTVYKARRCLANWVEGCPKRAVQFAAIEAELKRKGAV